MPVKFPVAPPSARQIAEFKKNLSRCQFFEHAATLAGIPKKHIPEILKRGRLGQAGFCEFVDALDTANAELGARLLDSITRAADEGDLKSCMWIYKQRISPFEDEAMKRMIKIEAAIEEHQDEAENAGVSEDRLAEIEARLVQEALTKEIH